MFGSHLSIAGGLHNALLEAEKLGCATVQCFTKNQQQWKCKPLDVGVVEQWKSHCKRLGFSRTVSHDSYLINLASPDDRLWEASVELFAEEISRCAVLGIPYLVTHPGAHVGSGEEAGLKRAVKGLDRAYAAAEANGVTTCLEITAGQGILIIEAMKMQNEVRSPKDGQLKKLLVHQGANVVAGEVLAIIE